MADEENDDVIFRFHLDAPQPGGYPTLEAYYRKSIQDLLKIVRFYSNGKPVIVDAFAFLSRPHEPVAILDPES